MRWVKTFLNFILREFAKDIWVKVFKNGQSKILGRQALKNLKWNLPKQTNITPNFFKGCIPQIFA